MSWFGFGDSSPGGGLGSFVGTNPPVQQFQVGTAVEYFSATLSQWIPAKILHFNADRNTYNLDCKPDVPSNRIRNIGAGADSGTPVGFDRPTVVGGDNSPGVNSPGHKGTEFSPSGVSGVIGDHNRPTNFVGSSAQADGGDPFQLGAQVEYYSATANSWIPAKIQYINADGTYNLDCKPLVTRDRIRPIQGLVGLNSTNEAAAGALGGAGSPIGNAGNAGSGSGGAHKFAVGAQIEYLSGTLNQWISARILSHNNDGTYNLDCKPLVAADRIRGTGMQGAKPRVLDDVLLEDNPNAPVNQVTSTKRPTLQNMMAVIPEIESFSEHPMKSATAIKSLDTPIQLIKITPTNAGASNDVRFEVCKEAVEILRGLGSTKISVISVGGMFRTGKSYLMNLLLDRVQNNLPGFATGNSTNPCTKGIWMYGLKPTVDDGHMYLYLDCQGFGGADSSINGGGLGRLGDAKLMALSILMSSVFILNCKGALNEQQFRDLNLLTDLKNVVEDQGTVLNKPSLVWLMRDFALSLEDTYGNPLTSDEYLERGLSSAPDYPFDREKAIQGKDTRMAVFKFFPDRRCRTLVCPLVDEARITGLPLEQYNDLRQDFKSQFQRLQDEVYRLCSALGPKRVGKEMAFLSCRAFPSFLAHLCDSLNAGQKLELCNSWDRVAESSCCHSVENLTAEYREALELLRTKFPVADHVLLVELKALRSHMKARYKDESLGDEGMRDHYWKELKESIQNDDQKLWEDNNTAAEQKIFKILKSSADFERSSLSPNNLADMSGSDADSSGAKDVSSLGNIKGRLSPDTLLSLEKSLRESAIPSKACHGVAMLLLKAYQQVADSGKLTELRIKEHEAEKESLRKEIEELESDLEKHKTDKVEEVKRMQDRVDELIVDLEDMKKKYDEEQETGRELRDAIQRIAEKGTDKEKELAKQIAETDAKLRKMEKETDEKIESERRKREDEREKFDSERKDFSGQLQKLKDEHKKDIDREHKQAQQAWDQLKLTNQKEKSLNEKVDKLNADLLDSKKKEGCKGACVVM